MCVYIYVYIHTYAHTHTYQEQTTVFKRDLESNLPKPFNAPKPYTPNLDRNAPEP